MGIRKFSAASDLRDEIVSLCNEALAEGLQPDQIQNLASEAVAEFLRGAAAEHADD